MQSNNPFSDDFQTERNGIDDLKSRKSIAQSDRLLDFDDKKSRQSGKTNKTKLNAKEKWIMI